MNSDPLHGGDRSGLAEHMSLLRGARYWPVVALFVGLISPLIFSTWYSFNKQHKVLEAAIDLELQQVTSVLANGMREPIWNLTPALGQPLVDSLMSDERVIGVYVTSFAQPDFLQAGRGAGGGSEALRFNQVVRRDGDPIGEVFVEVDPTVVSAQLSEQWPEIYALGVVQVVLGFGVVMFVYAALRRQERAQALRDMNRRLTDEVRARADELQEAHAALLRKESLAVLGRLTATVSHELRNPLGTIDTSVSTISRLLEHDDGLTASNLATIDHALRRVQRNVRRCSRITDELLGFTQQGTGHRQATEMDDWIKDVVADYDLPEGIEWELHLDSDATLDVDRGRLGRALTNLFGNAVQAMGVSGDRPGLGVLRVAAAVRGQRLEIRVRDTGGGIPPELHEQIFEPLFSTRAFGFGLGLPFVKQVVEQHGGSVEVVDVSVGAELLIGLPLSAEGLTYSDLP